jgi:hypothetical protein
MSVKAPGPDASAKPAEPTKKTSAPEWKPNFVVGYHNAYVTQVANWACCCKCVESLKVEQNSSLLGTISKIALFAIASVACMIINVAKGAWNTVFCCCKKTDAAQEGESAKSADGKKAKGKDAKPAAGAEEAESAKAGKSSNKQESSKAPKADGPEANPDALTMNEVADGFEQLQKALKVIDQRFRGIEEGLCELQNGVQQSFQHLSDVDGQIQEIRERNMSSSSSTSGSGNSRNSSSSNSSSSRSRPASECFRDDSQGARTTRNGAAENDAELEEEEDEEEVEAGFSAQPSRWAASFSGPSQPRPLFSFDAPASSSSSGSLGATRAPSMSSSDTRSEFPNARPPVISSQSAFRPDSAPFAFASFTEGSRPPERLPERQSFRPSRAAPRPPAEDAESANRGDPRLVRQSTGLPQGSFDPQQTAQALGVLTALAQLSAQNPPASARGLASDPADRPTRDASSEVPADRSSKGKREDDGVSREIKSLKKTLTKGLQRMDSRIGALEAPAEAPADGEVESSEDSGSESSERDDEAVPAAAKPPAKGKPKTEASSDGAKKKKRA